MTAEAVLHDLLAAGIRPKLTPDRTGIVVPKGAITPDQKVAILANKAELIRLLSDPDQSAVKFLAAAQAFATRVERFTRIGLVEADAEELAKRLTHRDADPFEHRTLCAECTALVGRPGRWKCNNYRRAALNSADLPSAFVVQMLQHCPGHMPAIRTDN